MRRAPVALAATMLLVGVAAPEASAFGGPMDASTADGPAAAGPAIAGSQTVAWKRSADGSLVARHVAVDGALGPIVPVSDPGDAPSNAQPAAAVAGGSTVIGWVRQSDAHLLVRRLDGDGSLGPTWDVSGTSLSLVNGQAAVAANASGRVAVAWRRGNDSHVFFRAFDVMAGPATGAADLTADPDIALFGTNVQVAIDPSGVAVVVWHRNTDCHIIGRRTAPDGTPGAQQDISGQADNAVGDTNPGVMAAGDGDEIFAWHHDGDSHDKHAVVRRWRADLSLDGIQHLSSDADHPSMAGFGTAALPAAPAVIWQRESDAHVVAAKGSPSPIEVPTDVSRGASAAGTAPAAAMTNDGGLAVAWKAADGHVAVAFEAGSGIPPVGGGANPGTGSLTAGAASGGALGGGAPGDGGGGGPGAGPGPGGGDAAPSLVLPRSARVRRGKVTLAVACGSAAPCAGRVELVAKRVVLARARFALAAGGRRTVALRLRRAVRHTTKATLVLHLSGASDRSVPLTLRAR